MRPVTVDLTQKSIIVVLLVMCLSLSVLQTSVHGTVVESRVPVKAHGQSGDGGCHQPPSPNGSGPQVYNTISVSDARTMIQSSPNLMVVDVRTPQEYAQGHLQGAINIPLSDLPLRVGGLEKNRPILVYCRTGIRSAQASSILVNAGFTNVYNLEGGITAWINAGYPTVTS